MLTLTEKFQKDIQQNHSTVYPLIIIDNQYYISTIKEVIKSGDESFVFEDYGLKISNIKESIDIQSHSFKISNVTLTLNNYEQDGLRLSDTLSDKINKPVEVYYKTQSCQTLEDCLLAYKGLIRRNSHDHSSLTITLEDLTDIKLHKEVPVANLGFSKNTYSKNYINRPIPITYGEVEKAPVIPWVDSDLNSGRSNLSIIADDVDIVTGSGRDIFIDNFDPLNEPPELKFEIDPNNADLLYNLGVISADTDDIGSAKSYYNRAIAADPKYTKAYLNLVVVMMNDVKPIMEIQAKLGNSEADYIKYDEYNEDIRNIYLECIPYLVSVLDYDANNIPVLIQLRSLYSAVGDEVNYKLMKEKVEELEN